MKAYTKVLFWFLAVLITMFSFVYQRMTGPTYPVRGSVEINDQEIGYSLIRSYDGDSDAPVEINVPDEDIKGTFKYKRYPSYDEWVADSLVRDGNTLIAYIPHQPAAGKVKYLITIHYSGKSTDLTEEPVIIRFRDPVPTWAIIPHVLFMFFAMVLSARAGIEAITKGGGIRWLTYASLITLIIGGLVFGPIMQKFAFGEYWTGWPLGTDLTDNKTAVAFIFWVIAAIAVWKNPKHCTWVIVAAVVTLIIYLIPHSLLGSEIDFTEKEQMQDKVGYIVESFSCLKS